MARETTGPAASPQDDQRQHDFDVDEPLLWEDAEELAFGGATCTGKTKEDSAIRELMPPIADASGPLCRDQRETGH